MNLCRMIGRYYGRNVDCRIEFFGEYPLIIDCDEFDSDNDQFSIHSHIPKKYDRIYHTFQRRMKLSGVVKKL